jgi:hypothetical protein
VDDDYTGADANGSFAQPFTTIQDGIDAQALIGAGDVIIANGAYVEDLLPEDGVNLKAAVAGGVTVTGLCTSTDVNFTMEGIHFIDDGVNNENAFHFTGVAAVTVRAILCDFSSTALGDHGLLCDNTNAAATMRLEGCTGAADVANANALVSLASGTLTIREGDLAHGDNTAESVELLGTLASTFDARDTTFTGTIAHEAAVANPVCTLTDCDIVVGAVAAGLVAAGNTMTLLGDNNVTSTEAAQDAFTGAGTVALGTLDAVTFLGAADEIATAAVTATGSFMSQSGEVAAAGASPQVDSVAFARVMPTAAYVVTSLVFEATGGGADDVICSVDEGTMAVGGFDIVTTSAAAAAISGNVHWKIELPTQ